MSLDRQRSKLMLEKPTRITNQLGAWIVANTLESHLGVEDDLTPERAALLRQMALDLAEWLAAQAA